MEVRIDELECLAGKHGHSAPLVISTRKRPVGVACAPGHVGGHNVGLGTIGETSILDFGGEVDGTLNIASLAGLIVMVGDVTPGVGAVVRGGVVAVDTVDTLDYAFCWTARHRFGGTGDKDKGGKDEKGV